jgi:hypothetical protein
MTTDQPFDDQPLQGGSASVADSPAWTLWRRFLFNFGTVYFVLYFLLLGQALLPASFKFWLADIFSRALLHTSIQPAGPTGAGDTAQDWTLVLLGLLASLLLGSFWTASLRRGPSVRHLSALSVGLRAALIVWLLQYGLAKFNFSQFGLLAPAQLSQSYGESSPMGLLWRFMAASPGYQLVAGVAEVLPALLLLHRRTVTLGALIAVVTLTNVFALNMFYDVPVKLFSFHLLLAAMVLIVFDHARLWALLRGQEVPAQTWPRRSPLFGWAGWLATALCVGYLALTTAHGVSEYRKDQIATKVLSPPLKTRGIHWVSEAPYWR